MRSRDESNVYDHDQELIQEEDHAIVDHHQEWIQEEDHAIARAPKRRRCSISTEIEAAERRRCLISRYISPLPRDGDSRLK